MADSPLTRPSLLVRLRDRDDRQAWQEFVDRYGPLVYHFGRKRGLQDADAADLTQTVMYEVSGAIGRLDYGAAKGTFRSWLFTVVRHHLCKFLDRQKQLVQGSGDTTAQQRLDEQPAKDEADLWEQEYKRQRFLWAADRVRGSFEEASWQAFWQTAVEGRSAGDVAKELGMSVGAVYTARSRILERIRQQIQTQEEE
jgi:RNA polymerase sigma-70 factor (ECF subfamily)